MNPLSFYPLKNYIYCSELHESPDSTFVLINVPAIVHSQ